MCSIASSRTSARSKAAAAAPYGPGLGQRVSRRRRAPAGSRDRRGCGRDRARADPRCSLRRSCSITASRSTNGTGSRARPRRPSARVCRAAVRRVLRRPGTQGRTRPGEPWVSVRRRRRRRPRQARQGGRQWRLDYARHGNRAVALRSHRSPRLSHARRDRGFLDGYTQERRPRPSHRRRRPWTAPSRQSR